MGIRRPYFYLATLLENAEAQALYDRLVLECSDPESKLLIPKVRRRSKSAASSFCTDLYFILSEAEKSTRDDCCASTKSHKDEVEALRSDLVATNERPTSINNPSGSVRDQAEPGPDRGAPAAKSPEPSAGEGDL